MHFEVSYTVGVGEEKNVNSGAISVPDALAFLLIQTCNSSDQSGWGHAAQIMNTERGLFASNCFPVKLKNTWKILRKMVEQKANIKPNSDLLREISRAEKSDYFCPMYYSQFVLLLPVLF